VDAYKPQALKIEYLLKPTCQVGARREQWWVGDPFASLHEGHQKRTCPTCRKPRWISVDVDKYCLFVNVTKIPQLPLYRGARDWFYDEFEDIEIDVEFCNEWFEERAVIDMKINGYSIREAFDLRPADSCECELW